MSRACHSIRTSTVLVFALNLALAACDSPVAPGSLEGPPDVFEFSTSTVEPGFTTTMRLEGDEIVVTYMSWDGPPVDTTRFVPTAEAWRTFWDAAGDAGIHRWRSRYANEDVIDGGGWSLTIEAGGLEVESNGLNAYPDSRGFQHGLERPESFQRFTAAIAVLSDDGFWSGDV